MPIGPQPGQTGFGLGQKAAQTVQHEQLAVDGGFGQAGEDRVTVESLDGVETVQGVDGLAAQGEAAASAGEIGDIADYCRLAGVAQESGAPGCLAPAPPPASRQPP